MSDPATTAPEAPSADDRPILLHARAVTKRFGGLVAVNSAELVIPQGSIVSLIGPNGAGKTTFFNVVAGILDPTGGQIDFRGHKMVARAERGWLEPFFWVGPAVIFGIISIGLAALLAPSSQEAQLLASSLTLAVFIAGMLTGIVRPQWYDRIIERAGIFKTARPNDMVRAGIGRTFQNIRLFQNMTVLENVLVGRHIKLHSNLFDAILSTRRQAHEEAAAADHCRELLALVGLKGRDDVTARNLPYGDQRRLEIARALAGEPVLLLLDEPTAGMNPNETEEMKRLIAKLRAELGLTILLIEHDMRVVMGVSDRITVLDHGECIAEGTPEEVRANPRVIEAYLGAPAA